MLTTLHSFCAQYPSCGTDGVAPLQLLQATNGKLYGITTGGGANGYGTVFEITQAGVTNTLYSFCAQKNCTDGKNPASLLQGADGNFYGTARMGGNYTGSWCEIDGCGTIFRVTQTGKLFTMHTFAGTDGRDPGALVQATDGNFYGAAGAGGINSEGTIFEITPTGTLTTLHTFAYADGEYPNSLMQATDGNFYGTTAAGGADSGGTIYKLSTGLGPFVETLPTGGKVGARILILGNDLKGTTKVAFNGTPAGFVVISNTEIKASVPTGATTGTVTVTTPSGTLSNNVVFRVAP